MMNTNLEELLTTLYDTIQDAKSLPLSSDKCIIERDKVLDLLDELESLIPSELKQAQTIIASRDELISQARREADSIRRTASEEAEEIVRGANEEAAKLLEHETIYQQTLQKCQEMAEQQRAECEEMAYQTNTEIEQTKAASFSFVDRRLRETEDTIAEALEKVRAARSQYQAVAAPTTPVQEIEE